MTTAVKSVVTSEGFDGFFEVGPDQPDLHLRLVFGQCVGKRQKDRGAGCAIIGANESGLKQRVVMPGKDEDGLFRIACNVELPDNIVYFDGTARRVGGEIVVFNLSSISF